MRYPEPELDRESAMNLWIEERSDYAKEQVILNNVGIVGMVLKSMNLNPFDEDLFQIGIVGLVKAINIFDPERQNKYATYATWAVRNELLNHFMERSIVAQVSLDERFASEDGDGYTLGDMLSSGDRFEDLAVLRVELKNCMRCLSEREKFVIVSFANGETQTAIARKINTSKQNVRRILKSIQVKIRKNGSGRMRYFEHR